MPEDHHRRADDALITLAQEVGEIKGTQLQILEEQRRALDRQLEEDRDHGRIYKKLHELAVRMEDVPQATHHRHHDVMEAWIEADRAKAEFYDEVKMVMVKRALPIALFSLLIAGLYFLGAKESAVHLIGKFKP